MNAFGKILKRSMAIVAVLAVGFVLVAAKKAEPDKKEEFRLGGIAHKGKDIMSITITNHSPDDCDYLIADGFVSVKSLDERDSGNVLEIAIIPPMGGNEFVRVSPSDKKAQLLLAGQMMRTEFALPEEYKNAKFDVVEVHVSMCKTPILGKSIELTGSNVQLPVRVKE